MDALEGFEYKHNNYVKISTNIGEIELTYKTRDGQCKEEGALAALFVRGNGEEIAYDEPARNEDSFFQVALLGPDSKIRFLEYGVTADAAIKSLYVREAVARMEAEFYPKSFNY